MAAVAVKLSVYFVMPVTLDTRQNDKVARGSKGELSPRASAIAAAIDPAEKRGGLLAFVLWLGILAVLCLPWFLKDWGQSIGLILVLWSAISSLYFAILSPSRLLGALRRDPKALVSSKNRASLKTVMGKVASLLNAAEPSAFVDATREAPRVRILPGALVFNEPVWKQLTENEVNALAVRGIAHQRLGHARRLTILNEFDRLPSRIYKFLVWPVWIYVSLLEGLWLQHALQSADRIALLVVRNFALLLSAIVKEKAANDAQMQALGVQSSDVANWVAQRGHIGMAGEEISIQYKLGRAIHENPPFERRVLNLQNWSTSPEFNKAVEQLAKRR